MNSKIFSLEIFIDRLRLAAGEKCLFPTTILKLLNYEPALISSIDDEVQDNLREYIDPINNLGKVKQIEQLKDAQGNYLIRKGKSILFDADTVSLMSELSVLPVYILLTDDYYNPSHLVGVVAINLSSVMHRLAQKISHHLCTVSEDTGGRFPIVNLMGDGVGALTLRIRLIYVGDNIASHVTAEQELVVRERVDKRGTEVVNKSVGEADPLSHSTAENKVPLTVVRNFGCQVDGHRSIRIQVAPNLDLGPNRIARIGLSIDPNDPLLEGPPPLIYNSCYANDDSCYGDDFSYHGNGDETTRLPLQPLMPKENPPSKTIKTLSKNTPKISPRNISKNMPILNALFSELKAWKSEDFVEETIPNVAPTVTSRSKSVDIRPPIDKNPSEFLRRMSTPKVRPESPNGMVPKNLGWLRSEPQYTGPTKSALKYKLTKTQLRRIELKNPRHFHNQLQIMAVKTPPQKSVPLSGDMDNNHSQSTTYTEPRLKQRHPLVPPLFNAGTSISVPTFTQTASSSTLTQIQRRRDNDNDDRTQRLPPRSPDRQRNNNGQIMSHETDGTLEEADHFLSLNPVQSNRSPQMTIRSQATMMERDDKDETEEDEWEREEEESEDDRRNYAYNDEYSDEFNGSFSSSNGPLSLSRRQSNVSQVSQTSEWRTEYSRGSSISQNYLNKPQQQSPPLSPDLGTYRSPPKSPIKSRRSLLAKGVIPGGRFFAEMGSSRQMRSSDSFAASFDEAAERTNYSSSSASMNAVTTERDRDDTVRSVDLFDGHHLRPTSAAADVTSFTKVTKFDRSLAPGRPGANYLTSTVASMQTDDSQMLTSDSFS